MFKNLNSDDIVVGSFPVIEPAGADSGGVLVLGTDYSTHAINKAGANSSATKKKYSQIANIIQGDSTINLPTGTGGNVSVFTRNSFKESISPRTFSIGGVGIDTGSLVYTNAGRQFKGDGAAWYLYPDVGILLHTGAVSNLKGCSEETVTITNTFIRINPGEFNYSTNPSFSDEDGNLRFSDFTDNPRTYITTIGFYNDNGDCLAVAKVDQPTENSFEKALLFKVEMKF